MISGIFVVLIHCEYFEPWSEKSQMLRPEQLSSNDANFIQYCLTIVLGTIQFMRVTVSTFITLPEPALQARNPRRAEREIRFENENNDLGNRPGDNEMGYDIYIPNQYLPQIPGNVIHAPVNNNNREICSANENITRKHNNSSEMPENGSTAVQIEFEDENHNNENVDHGRVQIVEEN